MMKCIKKLHLSILSVCDPRACLATGAVSESLGIAKGVPIVKHDIHIQPPPLFSFFFFLFFFPSLLSPKLTLPSSLSPRSPLALLYPAADKRARAVAAETAKAAAEAKAAKEAKEAEAKAERDAKAAKEAKAEAKAKAEREAKAAAEAKEAEETIQL